MARRAHVKAAERHETALAERRRCRAEDGALSGFGHEEGVSLTPERALEAVDGVPFIRDLRHALGTVDRVVSVVPGLDEKVADKAKFPAPRRPDEKLKFSRGTLLRRCLGGAWSVWLHGNDIVIGKTRTVLPQAALLRQRRGGREGAQSFSALPCPVMAARRSAK